MQALTPYKGDATTVLLRALEDDAYRAAIVATVAATLHATKG